MLEVKKNVSEGRCEFSKDNKLELVYMKNIVSILAISLSLNSLAAQDVVVKGPDEKLQLVVFVQDEETPCYSITYNGKAMLEKSPWESARI